MDLTKPLVLAFAVILATEARGQPPAPPPGEAPAPPAAAPVFDAAQRQAVVAAVAKAMRNGYVDPAVGARAADKVEHALAAGEYDGLLQPALAQRLTADLSDVAHDKHLRITAASGPPPGAPTEPPPMDEAGIVRADRLAGDIGYIEVDGFPPPDAFKPALDRAMTALSSTRALIVDVRRNGGGSPQGVAYLVGFFVKGKPPVHVMDLLWRVPGADNYVTNSTFTSPTPASFAGKPVYVLTSQHTFSGGEEFCYDMQTMKLGTLVGETTGGGANPGGARQLGDGMQMFLPGGKAQSPITGTSWEGVGVSPDIAVPSPLALKTALQRLGRRTEQTDIAKLSQASLFHIRDTPLPGTEAALRRLIESSAQGAPDYDQLAPTFSGVVRQQAAVIDALIAGLGPIQSITFRGPGLGDGDSYEVRFAKGAQNWSISLAPDGKVKGALFGPAPAAPSAAVKRS